MSLVRFGLIGACAAALAAFLLPGVAGEPAPAAAPPSQATAQPPQRPTPAEMVAVPDSGSREPERPEAVAAPPQERAAPSRGRRWSGRRASRYQGPIPSPEDWKPPEGPTRIGLQAGHWKADEAPRELSGLRDNGTSWRGTPEWKVNLEIARRAAAMLEERGYVVDLLPAVVPPGYRAHLFISIHADGSNDPHASGFRVAAPRRDATGRAQGIATLLERSYGKETGIPRIPTVTRRMRSYYAFNFRRYEHALDPMTIGVIIETGFLSSARDRTVIVDDPDRAARGIVAAVEAFPETPPPDVSTAR